jgi:DNA mismatch repair protein MutL
VINKIAAGEVIDRPSSVVKELVENSIDAGATEISVLLKDGGKTLIQVIDDGLGMNEQDAILSFQRHATSKIQDFADVERVMTLGFRGEALASIASVARVEMKTIPQGQIEGTLLQINSGIITQVGRTGGNPGTSIAVKNLFYNTPARRKFLRADSTEYRHILSVLNHFTLAYPEIEFSVYHEDHQIYSLKKTESLLRISEVLGSGIGDHLLPIDEQNAVFNVIGFLGDFDVLRKSRDEQYFFVNRRHINDRTLASAVLAGYGELLPKGRFPVYLLFFEIDPERIDVNVHPTKSEIKFADQQILFSLLRGAVKRALFKDHIVPQMGRDEVMPPLRKDSRFRSSLLDDLKQSRAQQGMLDFETAAQMLYQGDEQQSSAVDETRQHTFGSHAAVEEEQGKLWQAHNKYIVSQIKSGLVIIDQHAAHERVTYERVKAGFQNKDASSQQLLFPHTIDLSAEDFALLMDILPLMEKIGFIIKGFGARTVVVEGIPAGMRIRKEEKILLEILDEYKLNMGLEVDMQERVAKSVACRASIMSGDRLAGHEMSALIDQLFACETPYFCPHGRPTMITLSLEELDHRFERT